MISCRTFFLSILVGVGFCLLSHLARSSEEKYHSMAAFGGYTLAQNEKFSGVTVGGDLEYRMYQYVGWNLGINQVVELAFLEGDVVKSKPSNGPLIFYGGIVVHPFWGIRLEATPALAVTDTKTLLWMGRVGGGYDMVFYRNILISPRGYVHFFQGGPAAVLGAAIGVAL